MKHAMIGSFDNAKGFGFTTTGVFVHMNDGRTPTIIDGRVILGPDHMPSDRYPKRGDRIAFILKKVQGKRNANPWSFADDICELQDGIRASILSGMVERLHASGFPNGESRWSDGNLELLLVVRRRRHKK